MPKKRKVSKSDKPRTKISQKTNVKQIVKITQPVKKIYKKGGADKTKSSGAFPIYVPQYISVPQSSGVSMSDVLNIVKSQTASSLQTPMKIAEPVSVSKTISAELPMNISVMEPRKSAMRINEEVIPLPVEEAFPSTEPTKKKVQIIRPLPVEEAFPSTEPTKKKVQIIRPLPVEEAFPSTEPITKKISIVKKPAIVESPIEEKPFNPTLTIRRKIPKDTFSEKTPSLFSELPFEEGLTLIRPADISIGDAKKIIALNEGKSIKQVSTEYNKEKKENPKGVLKKYREKAFEYQQSKRFDEL